MITRGKHNEEMIRAGVRETTWTAETVIDKREGGDGESQWSAEKRTAVAKPVGMFDYINAVHKVLVLLLSSDMIISEATRSF